MYKKYSLKKAVLIIALLNFCHSSFCQTTIYMQKENGIFMIPCKVNGIPMNFIFDTGASNVSISKTEADFLMKQNLLGPEDVLGIQEYKTANGNIVKGKIINLKTIKINDIVLSNIKATIIPTQNAPLLLGQNVISKLGGIEINGNRLTIHSVGGQISFKNDTDSKQYLETKFNQFLGVDLTKKPTDFNPELERYLNFEKDNYKPLPFEMLQIKNYQLKSFGFDKKIIRFSSKGQAQLLMLLKQLQNKTESQNAFKELKDFFTKIYNKPEIIKEQSTTHFVAWNFNFYSVALFVYKNNDIGIVFNRYIEDIENSNRQFFTDWINDIIYHPDKMVSTIARFEGETLHFFRDIKIVHDVSKETEFIKGNSKKFTEGIIRSLIQNEQAIEGLENCYIDQIIFTTKFYFIDSSSKELNIKIYWNNLMNLPVPYTKEEFNEILH